MNNLQCDLARYDNSWYEPGGGKLKRLLWYFVNAMLLKSHLNPVNGLKVWLLRRFGAKIGQGVVVKPGVSVKYPWMLDIGDYTWIGEDVWIDNLAKVSIGSNCCISQGAMLLCGNHNFKKTTFDLIVKPIIIEDGAWIGAKTTVCPGVTVKSHSVLCVGSVANNDLQPFGVYKGIFAERISTRNISN
ncbi:MAG: WcaF family extracellular polysaccharide biosynthesis acetyltransferase [Muribaculaceae bacterium]|nr:WcaF family extracellular polysaccharide biosynthesis acetyltransferase [Muribaculaceae bacterium]